MKITMIGTGYVGLVSGVCFAEINHDVTCVDINEKKIKTLKDGKSPFYEPGLNDLLTGNIKGKRLHFSTGLDSVVDSNIVFLAIQTPSSEDGSADLSYFMKSAEEIAPNILDDVIIVIKSTVPIGTHVKVKEVIASLTKKKFHIVNNPEFLKEGNAINDFMRPDRIIIGHDGKGTADIMSELYAPLIKQGNPIYMMSNLSAEMTKYAANGFLASKISFINDIARLCDVIGADIDEVRKGITSDKRIGKEFFYPGPGYGGSCFPKDVKELIYTAKMNGIPQRILEATECVNEDQKDYMFEKITRHFEYNISNKIFSFWGVAFKANTDDVRESPALHMAKKIIERGGKIKFYDPVAGENFILGLDEKNCSLVEESKDKYECLRGSDGLVIMTEWREFSNPDFEKIHFELKTKVIFDARNLFNTSKVKSFNFDYYAVGKKV